MPRGTLVLLHGLLPHWSAPNTTGRSRHAYSLHVIDGRTRYPSDNWLSPRHANFLYRGEKLVVRDEGSLNGVYVRIRQHNPTFFARHITPRRAVES